jgi:hypothetical protein
VFLKFITLDDIKVNKAKVYYLILFISYLAYASVYNLIERAALE